MRLFGIEFAPLFIPFERRIQTFAVAQWFFTSLVLPFLSAILLIYSLVTTLFPIGLLYIFWAYFYDFKTPKLGARPQKWLKNSKIWEYYRDYFPIKLVKTVDLDSKKNYIFGYHPHGILVCSAFCNFATEATGFSKLFPGIKPTILTLVSNFYFPILREYLLAFGVCDVSKESLLYLLTKCGTGNAIVIVVGGSEEALEARPESFKLTLNKRKGFIKIAIETGSSLVPCFGFHENELFHQLSNPRGSLLRSFQEIFKKLFHISPPLYYGRGVFNYTFGMMPYRKSLTTVAGKPIDVVQNKNPSQEQIDELHAHYLKALNELFEENKLHYGIQEDAHLVFV